MKATNRKQVPWDNSALTARFYFKSQPKTGSSETRPTTLVPAPPLIANPQVLTRSIQDGLRRVGCFNGNSTGNWGPETKAAAVRYNEKSSHKISTDAPTAEAISILGAIAAHVCPLQCQATQVEKEGQCKIKECPAGQLLRSDGSCAAPTPKLLDTVVNGAPGDGDISLARGLQIGLAKEGAKGPFRGYLARVHVTLSHQSAGKQLIHIEWLLLDSDGRKLGTVSQRNVIPVGSLDGAWGPTAEQAGGAAAIGLLKLLPRL